MLPGVRLHVEVALAVAAEAVLVEQGHQDGRDQAEGGRPAVEVGQLALPDVGGEQVLDGLQERLQHAGEERRPPAGVL